MKRFTIAAALTLATLAIGGAAAAQDPAPPYDQAPCELVHSLAQVTMLRRQINESLPDVLAAFPDDSAYRAMVLSAYEVPRYTTPSYRGAAMDDFANAETLACERRK